jgi:thioredoxin 2
MNSPQTTHGRLTIRCPQCEAWNRIRADRAAHGPKCGKCAQPLALDRPVLLSDDTFARTLAESDVPVLVDFYADWCGPCRMMAPSIDALARERMGSAIIAKLDTDQNPRTAGSFNIRGIPTTIVFRSGKETARRTGAVPKGELEKMLVG